MKLELHDLSVTFGKKEALKNISLKLVPGVYGILGENGAGKTTLFRSVLNLQKHTGKIEISGVDHKHIGYIPQQFDTLHWLTVKETLKYFACLKDIPKEKQESLIEQILKIVNLEQESKKQVQALSGGMMRRLGIAQALLDDPPILIMDEPMVGLDPQERLNFRGVIKDIKKDRIVLISSHEIRELEEFCESIVFLHQGVLCAVDSVENLYHTYDCTDLERIYFKVIHNESFEGK